MRIRELEEGVLYRCPECGSLTDSIKQYHLPGFWLYLLLYIGYPIVRYTCCPHCMRRHIILNCFTYNIISANLLWLICILPWGIIQLLRSYTQGHSYLEEDDDE